MENHGAASAAFKEKRPSEAATIQPSNKGDDNGADAQPIPPFSQMKAEHDAECENAAGNESEDDIFRNRTRAVYGEDIIFQADGDEGEPDDEDDRTADKRRYEIVDGFAHNAGETEYADDKAAGKNRAEDGCQTVDTRTVRQGDAGDRADGNVGRSLGNRQFHEKTRLDERAQTAGDKGGLNEKSRILNR